jgi:lipopolysaccharide transport system permease protein
MSFLAVQMLYKNRSVLLSTTFSDIKARYVGTVFGLSWSVIYPLLFLALYAVIYTMVFRVRIGSSSTFDYTLMIFSGLIPFLGFSEALGTGVTSVVQNKNLVKNTLFPIELIPVKTVLTSSVTMLFGLCIILPVLWFRGEAFVTQLMIPVIIVLQLLFTIGLIWILSALNVFLRDLGQVMAIIILFLMLVSPIAYTIDMIPKHLMILMYPNPLFYLIMLYRGCIMQGHIPVNLLLVFTGISFSTFALGYYVFCRLKRVFIDYV